ncbi:DUF4192 domain-containing protein [Streptomyces bluensis]|uniref:DUF4192 domain-containing protein n=1 Tax=Streptomyces bluensis TaxID=33897 RepID=UPI003319F21A
MTTSDPRIKINGPADFAQLLPFLVGHQPEDCIALHGVIAPGAGTGPTMALPLPEDPATWQFAAATFAAHFLHITRERGHHDIQDVIVFLCRNPLPGQSAEDAAESMWPLADCFIDAFSNLRRAPVMSVIALVDNRWWAYECELPGCCEGEPLPAPDDPTSIAAQLARLGPTPGRRSSDIALEYRPMTTNTARYHQALDEVGADIVEQTRTRIGQALVRDSTAKLIDEALQDFRNGAPQLADDIAARIIIGLQDNQARDHALTHSEDDDLLHARQLWSYLARRCVPPHTDLAPPLLTLLAWVAWRQEDIITARYALKEALTIDPTYHMANLLHEAINRGVDNDKLLNAFRTGNPRPADNQ